MKSSSAASCFQETSDAAAAAASSAARRRRPVRADACSRPALRESVQDATALCAALIRPVGAVGAVGGDCPGDGLVVEGSGSAAGRRATGPGLSCGLITVVGLAVDDGSPARTDGGALCGAAELPQAVSTVTPTATAVAAETIGRREPCCRWPARSGAMSFPHSAEPPAFACPGQ